MWAKRESVLVKNGGSRTGKILALDLDHTVVKPLSGRTFPRNPRDWTFWHETVPECLRNAHQSGWTVCIVSNQSRIGKGRVSEDEFRGKIDAISNALGVPLNAYVATQGDLYRKPNTGMWKMLIEGLNVEQALYVGDAAGREKDFSCSDRKFAANAGVPFQTPEAFFLGERERPFSWGLEPRDILEALREREMKVPPRRNGMEMVLLVGPPASGKSTLATSWLDSHVRINRDTLKTQAKCLKACREALGRGESVVVDNTNATRKQRSPYIDLARKYGAKVRILHIVIDRKVAEHLNAVRERLGGNAVPTIVYRVFYKGFEEPGEDEGEVIEIPFSLSFYSEEHRQAFLQYS